MVGLASLSEASFVLRSGITLYLYSETDDFTTDSTAEPRSHEATKEARRQKDHTMIFHSSYVLSSFVPSWLSVILRTSDKLE
jgi:hypothetical protein